MMGCKSSALLESLAEMLTGSGAAALLLFELTDATAFAGGLSRSAHIAALCAASAAVGGGIALLRARGAQGRSRVLLYAGAAAVALALLEAILLIAHLGGWGLTLCAWGAIAAATVALATLSGAMARAGRLRGLVLASVSLYGGSLWLVFAAAVENARYRAVVSDPVAELAPLLPFEAVSFLFLALAGTMQVFDYARLGTPSAAERTRRYVAATLLFAVPLLVLGADVHAPALMVLAPLSGMCGFLAARAPRLDRVEAEPPTVLGLQ